MRDGASRTSSWCIAFGRPQMHTGAMKNTIGRWKGKCVSVELVNGLVIAGTIKAIDKAGILVELENSQHRFVPLSAILQVINKKPAAGK
jgi:sRNA-binding regulator protein Hfq